MNKCFLLQGALDATAQHHGGHLSNSIYARPMRCCWLIYIDKSEVGLALDG